MTNFVRNAMANTGLAALLILPREAPAKPRPALPPIPERCLLSLRFNETNWWGHLRPAALLFDNIQLIESWSGYAFYAGAKGGSRLQYRLVETAAQSGRTRTNLNLAVGSLRFWFCPDWSSASLGGTGPGSVGRLIEVGGPTSPSGWWSLLFSEDGDAIYFGAQAHGQQASYLKAPIQFQAGAWHLITLTYGPKSCELYVDAELAAQGDGVALWPDATAPDVQGFSIGSDGTGQNSATGAFDDWTSFAYPLAAEEIAQYYKNTRPTVDLGAITAEEEKMTLALRDQLREAASLRAATLAQAGAGEGVMSLLGYGTNDYGTNLWLEIQAPDFESARVILRNTTADTRYQLLARADATPGAWIVEETVFGATNQNWTATTVNFHDRFLHFFQAGKDSDGDGLVDYWEGVLGTSPGEQDSDSDGVNDYLEMIQGRDPLRAGADADTAGVLNFKVYTPFR
jgi:hypothetical protein